MMIQTKDEVFSWHEVNFQTQTYREQLSNWTVFVFFYFSDEFEDGLDEMGKIGGAMISPN